MVGNDSVGTVFTASRSSAAKMVLLASMFVAVGLLLINAHGLVIQAVAWLSVAFGCCGVFVWMGAVVVPMRLTITADGFSVRQFPLPERQYAWKQIDRLWAKSDGLAPMVVWTYKERSKLLAVGFAAIGRSSLYDGGLSPVWRVSAYRLADILNAARENAAVATR